MSWKILIALLLLLPTCWWCGLPPLLGTVELAELSVLWSEESACSEICVHPSSLVDPPQESATFDISYDECAPHGQLIALLPHPHAARDRPPPLFSSLSHSLRAPPSLMLA